MMKYGDKSQVRKADVETFIWRLLRGHKFGRKKVVRDNPPGVYKRNNHPVEKISWHDVIKRGDANVMYQHN